MLLLFVRNTFTFLMNSTATEDLRYMPINFIITYYMVVNSLLNNILVLNVFNDKFCFNVLNAVKI